MNIIMSDISGASVFIIPIVPVEVPLSSDGAGDEKNSIDGRFLIVDNKKLRTLEWTSFFPMGKDYKFIKAGSNTDGYVYVGFIELMKKFKLPVRIILTTKGKIPFANMLMSIEKFNWYIDKAHDIQYTISLTEFPETFAEFISREKEIWKYIKNLDVKNTVQDKLKKIGLLQ